MTTPETTDEAREYLVGMLGEGFHTAFRKAVPDSHIADRVWHLINDMPEDEWAAVLYFVVDGLRSMNVEIRTEIK